MFEFGGPHRRYNPLSDEWVLVSPHRTQRPWQGMTEEASLRSPSYDPDCYLCPGNTRANGESNPAYTSTYVFANDFSALMPVESRSESDGLFQAQSASGECRVVCFSPRHDLTLADMDPAAIEAVIETWQTQSKELGERCRWVQVFENKGAIMGCSNPHPHGQIWASEFIPTIVEREARTQREHWQRTGRRLLSDALEAELASGERIVCESDHWVALVPFWATWPFELLVLPRFQASRLTDLQPAHRTDLAQLMKQYLGKYDALFHTSFPYTMGWHGAPFSGDDEPWWTLHAHYYPPLLRSASIKKFMVGYEMLAEAQRDLLPEAAAERLRSA